MVKKFTCEFFYRLFIFVLVSSYITYISCANIIYSVQVSATIYKTCCGYVYMYIYIYKYVYTYSVFVCIL